MSEQLPEFLRNNEEHSLHPGRIRRNRLPFIDTTIEKLADFIKTGYAQADTAAKKGLLQDLDPRTKLSFLLTFVILASFLRNISALTGILLFILLLYPMTGISLWSSIRKAFWPLLFFGVIVVSPAMLNIVSGGQIKLMLIKFDREHDFWIYHIPAEIGISYEGIVVVATLFLRISSSILITLLIISTTSFGEIIKAMGMFKVPDIILLSVTLSYKFIFILSRTTSETYLALRARWIIKSRDLESSKIIAGRIAFVFRKSWSKYEEVYNAMSARGFSGKVNLCYPQRFHQNDLIFLLVILIFGTCICFI